jgi:hypothetical protein
VWIEGEQKPEAETPKIPTAETEPHQLMMLDKKQKAATRNV